MHIGWDNPFGQLKIMTQPDQMCRTVRVVQETIIEPFTVTYPVTGQIEGYSRNHDQVGFVGLVINPCRTWFKNAERTLLQLINMVNPAKHHLIATDRRIQHPFALVESIGQNQPGIDLVVGRRIQCYAFSISILIKREQVDLRRAT